MELEFSLAIPRARGLQEKKGHMAQRRFSQGPFFYLGHFKKNYSHIGLDRWVMLR